MSNETLVGRIYRLEKRMAHVEKTKLDTDAEWLRKKLEKGRKKKHADNQSLHQ